MDVYGDNRGIIADCVDEIQPFIDEVLPAEDEDSEIKTEDIEVVIPADDYLGVKLNILEKKYSGREERMF